MTSGKGLTSLPILESEILVVTSGSTIAEMDPKTLNIFIMYAIILKYQCRAKSIKIKPKLLKILKLNQ